MDLFGRLPTHPFITTTFIQLSFILSLSPQIFHVFLSLLVESLHSASAYHSIHIYIPDLIGVIKMDTLKGYLVPKLQKKGAMKEVVVVPPMEMTVTPSEGSPIPTPLRNSFSSRPSARFPSGDFRNSGSGNILDIKADMMVNWLHQQQVERLWSRALPGEGVVLKKARDKFSCSPSSLRNEKNGFYDNVVAMNVRVGVDASSRVDFRVADSLLIVRHDGADTRDEDFPSRTECQPCPSFE
jgi:hypothetical protein